MQAPPAFQKLSAVSPAGDVGGPLPPRLPGGGQKELAGSPSGGGYRGPGPCCSPAAELSRGLCEGAGCWVPESLVRGPW